MNKIIATPIIRAGIKYFMSKNGMLSFHIFTEI